MATTRFESDDESDDYQLVLPEINTARKTTLTSSPPKKSSTQPTQNINTKILIKASSKHLPKLTQTISNTSTSSGGSLKSPTTKKLRNPSTVQGKSYRSKYSAKFVLLLKEYWLEIDDDADGRVSKKEFVNGWEKKRQNASPDNIIFTQSFFDLLDKNPSHIFSFRHLLSALFPMATKTEKKMMMELAFPSKSHDLNASKDLSAEQKKELEDIFNLFDKDGSGTITLEELREATIHLGMTKADLERLFGDMDKDGSNEVTKEEFMTGMKGNYIGRKKPSNQKSLG